jgi:hypothetical protein
MHQEGTARVVPIIVRTVNWQATELGKLQALPKGGKAVDRWTIKDAAWAHIEEGIRGIIQEFQLRPQLEHMLQSATNSERNPLFSRRYALLRVSSSQEATRFFLSPLTQWFSLDGTSEQIFAFQMTIKKHLVTIARFVGVPKASMSWISKVKMGRL